MIVYLRLDGFYVEAERRDPNNRNPVGVVRDNMLVDVSATAELCGINKGMNPRAAKRLCPNLEIFPWSHTYRAFAEEVRAKLICLTPFIEAVDFHESFLARPGGDLLETLGTLLPWAGYRLVAATASNKFAAKAAGVSSEGIGLVLRKVDLGDESRFVAPLPLEILEVPDTVKESLKRLGLRCVGDLFCFSREDLEDMYGPWALALDKGRHGQGDTHIQAYSEGPWVIERYIDEGSLEPLKDTLPILYDHMERAGLGLGFLSITLFGSDFSIVRRKVFPERVSQLPALKKAVSYIIDNTPLSGPITKFRLEAGDFGAPGIRQGDLFNRAHTHLETVIDGLKRRYGPSVIGIGSEISRREKMLALWDPLRSRQHEPLD